MLIVFLTQGHPLTRPELARLLERKSRDIRKPLERLLLHHLVIETKGMLELSLAWEEALEHAAMTTGAHAAQKRQRAVHVDERAALQDRLNQPLTVTVLSTTPLTHQEAA